MLASRTSTSMEVPHYKIQHSLETLVDCNTCYEQQNHWIAVARAVGGGMQVKL